jgi:DNA-binding NarL/FixJ family response regulator
MRIILAEDNALLRDGLTHVLEHRGHHVAAAVADAPALLAAVAEHQPNAPIDVAIVDVRMPPTHTDEGLRAALALRRDHPTVAVLVLSQYVETHYAAQLLAGRCDGVGYLLKDRVADVSQFLDALTRVAAGATVLDPEAVSQIMNAGRRAATLDTLTDRERQVLSLMAEGRSNTAIATTLSLSYASVEKHITNIFAKLGLPPSDTDHRRVLAVLRYLDP